MCSLRAGSRDVPAKRLKGRNMAIEALYDVIARCNRCGFCQVACPIFRSTGHEGGVARGKIALLRSLIEGHTSWSEELEQSLFACLLCGACTQNCFPAVPTAELMVQARKDYLERVGRKRLHRILVDHLLPNPALLRKTVRLAGYGRKGGLDRVAQSLGLLRFLGRDFPNSLDIVGSIPSRGFRDQNPPGVSRGRGRRLKMAYFVGCGQDILEPEAAEATLETLKDEAQEVHILNNVCCGLPAWTYGDMEGARRLAAMNLELLRETRVDSIVTDCSSCSSFLRQYPELFTSGTALQAQAQEIAGKVRDLVQLAPQRKTALSPSAAKHRVVTYHDPCHASRGQKLVREPRDFLGSLPSLEFRELPEADWCCGGAGSYALFHYDLAMQVLQRKMENVRSTGATLLLSSCPACLLQLRYGARKFEVQVEVRHLSQVMAGEV